MSIKNAQLINSAIGNEIYLGTIKKNSKLPVMNENRVLFTDQALRAVATHMMSMKEGECYEFPGLGKLIWKIEKPKAIEPTEQAQAEREELNP